MRIQATDFNGQAGDGQDIYVGSNPKRSDSFGKIVISRDNDGVGPWVTFEGEALSNFSANNLTRLTTTISLELQVAVGDIITYDLGDGVEQGLIVAFDTRDEDQPFKVVKFGGTSESYAWVRQREILSRDVSASYIETQATI